MVFENSINTCTFLDAMNGKFRKVDTHLHGMYYRLYKEIRAQTLRICANYFVGMIKSSVYGH
jgi:hypothetical protein